MILSCEKQLKTSSIECKKNLVVIERGLAKILYFRLYRDKGHDGRYKHLKANDELMDAIIKNYNNREFLEEDLKDLVQNVRSTYQTLKKSGQEEKTLMTVEAYLSNKVGFQLFLFKGILMKDGSVVFFYDFSDTMAASLESVFPKGGLF